MTWMGLPSATHDLPARAFPIHLRAYRADNGEQVWEAWMDKPFSGLRNALYVPPLAKQQGCPIIMRITTADGGDEVTGPYE